MKVGFGQGAPATGAVDDRVHALDRIVDPFPCVEAGDTRGTGEGVADARR
jgi:hypothetical protein